MGAPSNRTATLESQMIPMIQDVPGQTLSHSETTVRLYLQETITFLLLTTEAAVVLAPETKS